MATPIVSKKDRQQGSLNAKQEWDWDELAALEPKSGAFVGRLRDLEKDTGEPARLKNGPDK